MLIYLIRHPETVKNVQGAYSDPEKTDYSELGAKQLEKIKGYFKNIKLGTVYSSPIDRCIRVAKLISDNVVIEGACRDIDMGVFGGLTKEELQNKYPELYEQRLHNMYGFRPPEGESFKDMEYRAISWFLPTLKKEKQDFCIVTHAMTINMIIKNVNKLDFITAKTTFIPPGSITILEYIAGVLSVKEIGKNLIEHDFTEQLDRISKPEF